MDLTLKCAAVLMLLGLASASATNSDFGQCERIVKRWASSAIDVEVKDDKHTLQDLLFFLHVPRTGGRTYFHCFLKKLYSSSQECPRSYDKLRFNPSKPKCRLLVTHDDYSMMSKLQREKLSVVTILRDPVDRVFSTYEFSVEVAARFLVHPNLTSVRRMAGRLRPKTNGISTLDIWPWKYLVPWMREDLFARRDARKQRGSNDVRSNDSYDTKEVLMPLHEYIIDPTALDIVHNGATFQVAGLTNNSYFSESHEVRHCVQKHRILGEYILQVAKKRLDNMLYVGLTEDHRESATMFANVVGAQVISQLEASNSSMESITDNKSAQISSFSAAEDSINGRERQSSSIDHIESENSTDAEADKENMTVEKLMGGYESCISNLRKAQSQRRTNSLKRISPVQFSKEARRQVPEVVLQQIRSLNNLDLELYKYAQVIFRKQHENSLQKLSSMERLENMFSDSGGFTHWELTFAFSIVIIFLVAIVFVNARRRRTSKVKM
ncbi:protein-tyrosine sulfotransferase-like isoform X1 [Tripterygium wilfordii]|nr:protein-tyrosine sulfotransferase-like isoform X1 [Tripterygium wilfordii]XP_038719673.1 protein-tyrosine sulfotransferase-like isoform X1 [Tripterygium wilfordii]XP_038719682.1 protein-tyrosine sulfotransferase-like isoform X1 [Tripterygium wilfordii]